MYSFVTARTFQNFTKHLFLGKPNIDYFIFTSLRLKQWNNGKTERVALFLWEDEIISTTYNENQMFSVEV